GRLTFGPDSAVDATVLRDGRVLFVTAEARDDGNSPRHLCLFTVNNDGTEVTAYASRTTGWTSSGARASWATAGSPSSPRARRSRDPRAGRSAWDRPLRSPREAACSRSGAPDAARWSRCRTATSWP